MNPPTTDGLAAMEDRYAMRRARKAEVRRRYEAAKAAMEAAKYVNT